ncbi:anaerobic sulfatase maturase [Demequina sp. NBRC 110054]|uniref:anaerobic sulfatase maturase n=1 Tax=Demequina sp. NBRC 110054 TaxID=1570343 RepID=UPI0009FCAD1F|nr:anaerobic sulfatase maturase [Demequina sp. NBRC 110054]
MTSSSPEPVRRPAVVAVPGIDPAGPGGRRNLPFTVLAKPTGAACNLDCTYCFFLSKELLYDHDGQRMSEQGLESYLSNLLRSQPDGEVEIAWQGGEPTMRGLPFFRRAVALAEQLRRPKQTVRHTLQTNGTLLDDAWGEFLAERGFLIGLSVDGPAHLHDTFRVNKAGRATHAQVMRGHEVLKRHGVEFNILCTVHAANQDHGLEVYRYFRDELGARHMQFIPIVERVTREQLPIAEQGWKDGSGTRILYRQQGDAVTSRSVDPAAWGEFLMSIFDEWAARDVGSVFVQHFDVMLGNALGQYSMCVHSPECGAALAVEHTGDVYSCDHYVEPGYLLGNVADKPLQTMLRSPEQKRFGASKRTSLPRQCVECPVRWACHGGCPKDRFDRTADGEPGLNHLCAGYYRAFSHAEPTIRRMAEIVAPALR